MALAFNPITNDYYYTGAAAANNYYSGYVAANNNAAGVSAYDQVAALQQAQNSFALTQAGSNNVSADTSDDTSLLGSADLLDLSPAALNILNGLETADISANGTATINPYTSSTPVTAGFNVTGVAAITSGTTTDTLAVNGSLDQQNLTALQNSQVASIVSQYANQPLTQQTFTQIGNALTAVGIDPQQISLQQLLGAYSLAYTPGLAFTGQLFTDTLTSELDNA